jgi:DNA-binding GntR family transcriptional regulator
MDVIEALRRQIVSGQLRPGATVAEEDVASRLGTSRTPVREAIGRLVSEGLLVKDDNRSARVFQPSLQDLLEIYEIRLPLEILAARMAAERHTAGLHSALEGKLNDLRNHPVGPHWSLEHEDFHLTLFAGSGRGHLLEIISGLRLRSEPYVRFALHVDPKFRERSQADHAAMVATVAAGDGKAMERLVRRHLNATTRKVAELLNAGLWMPEVPSARGGPD